MIEILFSIPGVLGGLIIGVFIGYIFDKVNNKPDVEMDTADLIIDETEKPPILENIKDSVVVGVRGLFWGFFLGLTLMDSMSAIFNGSSVIYVPVVFAIAGLVFSVVLRRQKEGD